MSAYYNEHDKYAAAWLRELIKEGHIAPGDVDERSIEDVKPKELVGYTQCHFFAGIGIWSAALRGAGWPDDRPVWTGSCPCQPFSTAGKGKGVTDERHLWPAWFHLIQHGKGSEVPVFGEQVASKDGLTWLDIVQADMEGSAYSFRAVDLCAAGFGAPHIRQRIFFHAERIGVVNTQRQGLQGHRGNEPHRNEPGRIGTVEAGSVAETGAVGGMAHPGHDERSGRDTIRGADGEHDSQESPREGAGAEGVGQVDDASVRSASNGMGNTSAKGLQGRSEVGKEDIVERERTELRGTASKPSDAHEERPGPVNGFWRVADWLYGKDGYWRPTEPSIQPLVDESPARMVRLRGYGNGIVKEVAQGFIKAVMEG